MEEAARGEQLCKISCDVYFKQLSTKNNKKCVHLRFWMNFVFLFAIHIYYFTVFLNTNRKILFNISHITSDQKVSLYWTLGTWIVVQIFFM